MTHQGGTSLANPRRARDPLFTERVFVGQAIDIGAGPDPLRMDDFPRLDHVRTWDKPDGDATFMEHVPSGAFDLVYSSHCLEHIEDWLSAVQRWWNLVDAGGHLVIVVPDVRTYERGVFPSVRNADHKRTWSAPQLLAIAPVLGRARLVRFETLDHGFVDGIDADQTADGSCECGLEIVIRKETA